METDCVANNPKFHEVWEAIQREMNTVLTAAHYYTKPQMVDQVNNVKALLDTLNKLEPELRED